MDNIKVGASNVQYVSRNNRATHNGHAWFTLPLYFYGTNLTRTSKPLKVTIFTSEHTSCDTISIKNK